MRALRAWPTLETLITFAGLTPAKNCRDTSERCVAREGRIDHAMRPAVLYDAVLATLIAAVLVACGTPRDGPHRVRVRGRLMREGREFHDERGRLSRAIRTADRRAETRENLLGHLRAPTG